MPEISRFYGITVYMFYREHQPPHFHVGYGGQSAQVAIESLAVIAGRLSPRALGLVVEWAIIHQQELLANWVRARNNESLDKIDPLP